MKTERKEADTSRSSEALMPRRHLVWDQVERLSTRIPFRLKLAAVWAAILGVLAILFAAAKFDTQWMRGNAWFIVRGVWVTVFIAVVSICLAVVLALLGALGRLSRNSVAYGITGFYTSFFRGTPLIVQLYLIYLGLPQVGLAFREPYRSWFLLTAIQAGILGLSLNYGAYMTEIFRAGIQSVHHGQTEAAEALGMTYRQRMQRIVLPQAFRVIVPPTGNEFIAMMKDTALVSLLGTTITWADPFRRATLMGRASFRNLEALLVAALMYWVLTGVFSFFQRKLENRLAKGYVRQVGPSASRQKAKITPSAQPGTLGESTISGEMPPPAEPGG